MAKPDDRQTLADLVIVNMLCQPSNAFPGPFAWLCGAAWLAYCEGLQFDVDAAIVDRLEYPDQPQHAARRQNVVACVEHLKGIAAKKPLWELPKSDCPTCGGDLRNKPSRNIDYICATKTDMAIAPVIL